MSVTRPGSDQPTPGAHQLRQQDPLVAPGQRRHPPGEAVDARGREFLQELSLPAPWDELSTLYPSVIRSLTEEIDHIDKRIEGRAEALEETRLLMTIPGISHYTALVIYAELGDIDRFDRHEELVSYAGLDPVTRESGETKHEGGISKAGRSSLRWILVQCANVAVSRVKDPYLSTLYGRLKQKKNHQVAIVATARKMLVSIFYTMTRKEVYNPPGVTG